MFKAYFDRSELTEPAPVLAVTGYLSSDENWASFEPEWRQVLDSFGIEMFHMTELECRLRAFKDWPNDTRVDFLTRLIDLVAHHAMVAIGAAIDLRDYGALESDDQRRLGHPYMMCGLKAVADTLLWVDRKVQALAETGEWTVTDIGKKVPVEFIFEAGDEGAGELAEQIRKEQGAGMFAGRIVNCTFVDKRGLGALQAADFAAYETTKQLVRTVGADDKAMRKSFDALLDKVPYVAEYFDSRTMGEILERMRGDTGESE